MAENVTTDPALIVHVFRHAEADYRGPDGERDYNKPNPKLTPAGESYCRAEREAIRELRPYIRWILCSPLKRAIDTALLLFEEYINTMPLELLAELQCFGAEPSQLGDDIDVLEDLYGKKVKVHRLPDGYNNPNVKDAADWDQGDNRRRAFFELVEELWNNYGSDKVFEIACVTHSSVFPEVLGLRKWPIDGGVRSFIFNSDERKLHSISSEKLSKLRRDHGANIHRSAPSHD